MNPKLTIITSEKPKHLTKVWKLVEGKAVKESGGNMSEGSCETAQVESLKGFADLIENLNPNQALCYGLTRLGNARMMSKPAHKKAGYPMDVQTRTKADMYFDNGPGVFFIDYDPPAGQAPLSHQELWAKLCKAAPGLAGVGYVSIPSSSSYIRNRVTGEHISGLSGQRIYFFVKNAIEIPRAGEALVKRLWLSGQGWVEVSKAGSKLKRTLVDASVWQTNRFDFAAGAVCHEPLYQDRGHPVVVEGGVADLAVVLPELSAEESKDHDRIVKTALDLAEEQASAIRADYCKQRGREIAGPGATAEKIEECVQAVERACEGGTLGGDFTVMVDVEGEFKPVKILDLLMDPEKWHGADTLDPIEADYRGGQPVGKLYLLNGSPRLYSFAHGGRTYRLVKAPEMIELADGRTAEVIKKTLDAMRKANDVYEFGNDIVKVDDHGFTRLQDYSLVWWMGEHCQYYKRQATKSGTDALIDVPKDPPLQVAKVISSIGRQRQLPELKRVVSMPIMLTTGEIIDKPGFDASTGLLLNFNEDEITPVPSNPALEDAEKALQVIMEPFRYFPFEGVHDRTVLIAAVLSAVMRPVIDTCPGFGFDAPIQGSGKTLLAQSLHAIATGKKADVKPHVSGKDDEEIRKRVMALLVSGAECVVWDNILGRFNSASMAGLLTSASYTDRILGSSTSVTIPNMALWLFTGNNLQLAGDMPRRIFRCRINPNMDEPYARKFDFDPETFCMQRRFNILAAAMTIIRAWITAGRPHAKGRLASFEEWDDVVRQPIAWLSDHYPDVVCDPMDVMKAGQATDPEQEEWAELLHALHQKFRHQSFTAREVIHVVENVTNQRYNRDHTTVYEEDETIHDSIADAVGLRDLNGRRLGRFFLNRMDRICNGMRITKAHESSKGTQWIVHDNVGQNPADFQSEKPTEKPTSKPTDIGESLPF